MTNKSPNWKALFLDLPTVSGIHSIADLEAIKELTDGSGDEGPTPAWYRMSRETDIVYLFMGPNKRINLLHHVDLVGNRLSHKFIAVGLCNFGQAAPPVEIDLESDITTVNVRVPTWQNLLDTLNNVTNFKNLQVEEIEVENTRVTELIASGTPQDIANSSRAYHFKNSNIVAIPPGLVSVVLESTDRDPASLAVKFWTLMTSLDSEHEGETENYAAYNTYFRHLIRFLWSATTGKIPLVSYVISENHEVQVWAERIHSAFLLPLNHTHGMQPQTASESSNTALEQVAFSITALQDHLSNHKISTKDDESGGFTKKFGPHLQQLFLNASAVEPFETAAPIPNPHFEKFLAQKTLGSAKTFLRGHLKANPFLDFVPSPGLTTSAFTGNVLWWDDSNTPRNFSIFYCGRASAMSSTSSSYNDQALYLKEHIGNGISESEVK